MLHEYLSFIDFISPDITLYFNNKRSHSSKFSYILSIIIIILLILISFFFSTDFIYKINPSSYFYKIFEEDIGVFPINNISNHDNLSTTFYHFLNFDNRKIDERAFQIIGINTAANIILNKDISEYDHWIYGSCNGKEDIKNFYDYLNDYESIYLKYGLCVTKYYNSELKTVIDKNESNFSFPTVAHGSTNKNEIIYLIGFKKCENNTILNNNSCYDNETIENILQEYQYYTIYFLDHHIDLDNYENPIKYIFHNIEKPISIESYSSNYIFFEVTSVFSYDGIFLQSKKSMDTYLYYTYEASRNVRVGNSQKLLGLYVIVFNNTKNIYIRKYKLLTDVLVVVLGIIKVTLLIIKFLYFFPYNITIFDDFKFIVDKKYKKFFFSNKPQQNSFKFNNIKNTNFNFLNDRKKMQISIINNYINKINYSRNGSMNDNNASKNNMQKINKSHSLLIKKDENFFDENVKEFFLIKKLCNFNKKDKILFLFSCNKRKNLIYSQVIKYRKKILSEENLFFLKMSVKKIKLILKQLNNI